MNKVRRTFIVETDALERARNAVYWTPGLPLSSLVSSALHKAVTALENEQGTTFRKREKELVGGRPLKKNM